MTFATTTELLPHQRAALAKQAATRCGALFMDMGTGKTRTAIGLAHYRQNRIGNVVWFCPVSIKDTIAAEIRRHTDAGPDAVAIFDGRTTAEALPDAPWYIIGIESMSASLRLKLAAAAAIRSDSMVIVDESTYIKGYRASRTCWITDASARARYRLILTGTPLTQGVVDLFAQMRFLSPSILGYSSFYSFAANHLEYSRKYPGKIVRAHNVSWLAAKVQPYVYQVTKDECLDLPPKLYETRWCDLTTAQRVAYQAVKDEVLEALERYDTLDSIAIFRMFTGLQQVVSGFRHWRDKDGWHFADLPCRRVETMMTAIAGIPAGEKVIIWGKFRYDLDQIAAAIGAADAGGAVQFHGGLSERTRNAAIADWRRSDGPRFLVATPSCAGHGLTLNEAAYVVFYDNGFKYSERLQAEDRCHRLGQDRSVTYIDIMSNSGIDSRIAGAIAAKGSALKAFRQEVDKVKGKGSLRKLVEGL